MSEATVKRTWNSISEKKTIEEMDTVGDFLQKQSNSN